MLRSLGSARYTFLGMAALAVLAFLALTLASPSRALAGDHPGSTQGAAQSDPDDDGSGPDRSNGGPDKPGGLGGLSGDQDGNNGCGNDDDREDDNEGWCGRPPHALEAGVSAGQQPSPLGNQPPAQSQQPPQGEQPLQGQQPPAQVPSSQVAPAVLPPAQVAPAQAPAAPSGDVLGVSVGLPSAGQGGSDGTGVNGWEIAGGLTLATIATGLASLGLRLRRR